MWTPQSNDPPPVGIPWDETAKWVDNKRGQRAEVECPTCLNLDKEVRRKFNSGMVRIVEALFEWRREHGDEFVHLGDLLASRGEKDPREAARMASGWGVVEEEKVLRPDGGRAGHYRLTQRGLWWRLDYIGINSHAFDYRNDYIPDNRELIYYHDVVANQEKFWFDLEEQRRHHPRPPDDNEPPPSPPSPPPTSPSPMPTHDPVNAQLEQMREQLRKRHQRG